MNIMTVEEINNSTALKAEVIVSRSIDHKKGNNKFSGGVLGFKLMTLKKCDRISLKINFTHFLSLT